MWDPDNKNCSVIGEGLIVQGNVKSKSNLKIEGDVEGNVSCVSLLVGKSGSVKGDITTQDALIEGTVHGMIRSGIVELKDGSKLEGDVTSKTLAVDHGAVFTGFAQPIKSNSHTNQPSKSNSHTNLPLKSNSHTKLDQAAE